MKKLIYQLVDGVPQTVEHDITHRFIKPSQRRRQRQSTGLTGDFMSSIVFSGDNPKDLSNRLIAHSQIERVNRGLSNAFKGLEYNTDRYDKETKHDTIQELLQLFETEGGVIWGVTENEERVFFYDRSRSHLLLCISVTHGHGTIGFNLRGDAELIAQWKKRLDEKLKVPGTMFHTVTEIDDGTRGGASWKSEFVRADTPKAARASFYPFLKLPMEDYFDRYMASPANVLILLGPPGTGKSTFLRTLMLRKSENAMLAYNSEVLKKPKLFSHFASDASTILGLEDVDVFLEDRESGNTLMGSFLNSTEGVVGGASGQVKKVVFSTNLPSVNRIDAALMRRGRCFDVIEFRNLTRQEAYTVVEEMGLPHQDFRAKESWSLAEILNPPEDFLQMSERARKHIGFV